MAFLHQYPSLAKAIVYSDRYSYPLTVQELWFWQIGTSIPLIKVKNFLKTHPPDQTLLDLRRQRFTFSQPKWVIARQVVRYLVKIPTITAVFVTGSLAMDNCPEDDDIDLMIITYPHSLWLTRFLIVFFLDIFSLRRPPRLPEHSSPRVANKICDNLYLDLDHLSIPSGTDSEKKLYLAHEILQAKCLFDRFGVQSKFLSANSWVKKYLPVAYESQISGLTSQFSLPRLWFLRLFIWILRPINFLCFLGQYLFMRPKITSETITLGSAFFHPRKS